MPKRPTSAACCTRTGHLILCQTYPDIADAMFTGFAVVRGAELAAIEAGAFGIDHPAVGALWVETHRLSAAGGRHDPQGRRAACRPRRPARPGAAQRLRAGRGGGAERTTPRRRCAALPAAVQARFSGADGAPDAELREALRSAAGDRAEPPIRPARDRRPSSNATAGLHRSEHDASGTRVRRFIEVDEAPGVGGGSEAPPADRIGARSLAPPPPALPPRPPTPRAISPSAATAPTTR